LERGYELLASSRCRRILALSKAAAAGLVLRLQERGLGALAEKITIFRGAVSPADASADAIRDPSWRRPLKVLFVGRDAFGKGLLPTLDALDDCSRCGADIEATIVCNFENRPYISKHCEVQKASLINRMSGMPGVTWRAQVPNHEVHRLMRSHDVLLFPTLDESLGWVAVEAAMAGMPVVTTDVFALPEIVVDNQTGFTISLNKNKHGRWVGLSLSGCRFDSEAQAAFSALRAGLTRALLRFAEDPSLTTAMGDRARTHIQALYDPASTRLTLADVYAQAVKGI
jgi:glycosyltransferase involved in cell wall biosynthesis